MSVMVDTYRQAQQFERDKRFGVVVVDDFLRRVAQHYGLTHEQAYRALHGLPDWSVLASPQGWERVAEYAAAYWPVSDSIPPIKATIH